MLYCVDDKDPHGHRAATQKETALMGNVTERAEIDQQLGELERQRQDAGSEWKKVNQIQEKIGALQKRKDKLLGVTE